MEELRAHATDWTQNMDFRIPNPLEFNDPFLLQRRRWKRSERRRIRRGAQGTLGYWVRGRSENGHLPNRWAGLSSSMSQLDARSSLEKAVVVKARPRLSAAGEAAVLRAAAGSRADPAVGVQGQGRSIHHLIARSFSLPVARSTSELDSTGAAMQEGSFFGSESLFDSRSEGSSVSLSFSALPIFQLISRVEQGEATLTQINTEQEKDKQVSAEHLESEASSHHSQSPVQMFLSQSPPPPFELCPPSPHGPIGISPYCQLLDFFGENLAYIDESSDTPSDLAQSVAGEEKMRRPRKTKRRSMRRELPHTWSPEQARRPSMQPPSNPPTPPPDLSPSDPLPSEIQIDSHLW